MPLVLHYIAWNDGMSLKIIYLIYRRGVARVCVIICFATSTSNFYVYSVGVLRSYFAFLLTHRNITFFNDFLLRDGRLMIKVNRDEVSFVFKD